MAKIFEGAIKLASTIQQTGAQPLDDRVVVAKVSDLYNSFGTAIYNGMLVAVAETGDVYMLKDKTKVGEAAGWKLIGGDTAADLTKVKEDVAANKAAIGVINGTGEGSFKKGDADTLAKAKEDATTKANAVKGSDTDDAGAATVYGANKAAAAADAKAAKAQKTIDDFKGRTEGFATAAQGTLADNAVRVVTEGTANGTISVTTGAGAATDIAVHGLGSAAYTNSNAYATAAQGAKADAADTLSKANKAEIDIINGDASTTGSFAKGDADTLTTAKKYTDDSIAALDVTGNTSEAVKGVTVTVNETDGKVIQPVVSIAAGTVGGASDANLVTGKAVKNYVDGEITKVNTAAGTLSGRVDTLEDKVGSKAVEGGAAATGLFKEIADEASTARAAEKKNADAIAAETTRATEAETALSGRITTLEGTKHVDSLGGKTGAITVDGVGEGSYPVKLTMTDQKLGATISGLGTAAGQNADAFDPAGAANGVKTALVGEATEDYNTLAKLETKIKDEATTARAAEKKNADAIAAETTRAKAAEEKVKTDLLGSATDDYNTLGKLETKIKAAQSAADKVSGVKSDDKVISLGTDGKLSSTISLSVDATAGDDGKKYIRLKGINNADLGKIDIADFVKDGMLDSASLVTNPAGQSAGTYIKLTWNTDGGKQPMYIDVTSLIDIYTAKPDGGLKLEDHAFSVDTTKIATVESVNGVTSRVTTLEGKVGSAAVEGGAPATGLFAAIADEADRAMQAEAALLGKPNTDTSNSNTIYGAKKYTDASIAALDVTGNKSEAKAGIAVTVNETDGKVSKPIVEVTPGSVAADNASVVTGGAVYTAINDAKSALIGTDTDTKDFDTIKGAKKAVKDLEAQIKADAVTLTIPENDPYITASKAEGSNTYTIKSKLDTDGTTPLVDVKINTKLTEKINSLDGGGTSPAVKGVTVTVNETDGIVATPSISIAAGTVGGASDANLVTGDTVKTYVDTAITNAALVWNDIPTTA